LVNTQAGIETLPQKVSQQLNGNITNSESSDNSVTALPTIFCNFGELTSAQVEMKLAA
jgi:hypothetical protein